MLEIVELRFGETVDRFPGWLRRLVEIGAEPDDPDELRVRKSVLVLSATLMASLATVWVLTYALLGLWVPAAIPLVYQVASATSIWIFARTRRYSAFRASQLFMSLVFPFVLQWSLGGFEASSAVCLWGITSPMGALLFLGSRQSVPWFAAFVGLLGISALIDPALSENAADVPHAVVVTFFALNISGVAVTTYTLLQYFVRARERAMEDLARKHEDLEREQEKSERLLLNVLPAPVAARLKQREGIIADDFPEVTVLFADIVGFTPLTERLSASEIVSLLDRVFARWDELADSHGTEKIKTIGDAYMVAAGVPVPTKGPRRGDRRDGPGDGPGDGSLLSGDRGVPAGPDRHRQRAGRRRGDRPGEVHLRPLGGHRQHREPDGVPREAGHHPGDRARPGPARRRLRAPVTRHRRGQGQGADDVLRADRIAGRSERRLRPVAP